MKIKIYALAAAMSLGMLAKAQWPSGFNINTANNGAGVIPINNNDAVWKSSVTGISSGYSSAIRVLNPGWYAPPFSDTEWISYKHNCSSTDQSQSWCPSGADVDEYYMVTFTITGSPGTYAMNYSAFADNCIYRMYLNNTSTPFYTAPVAQSPYYGFSGFTSGNVVSNSIGGFVVGANTIYVHVKSGNAANSGNTGFWFRAATSYTPDPTNPKSCCLGNYCYDSQNSLLSDYEIPLNNNSFNFSGDLNDKVNVGYNCSTAGPGKLNAYTTQRTNTGSGSESIGIHGDNLYNAPGTGVGVMGEAANADSKGMSVGVWGNAAGAFDNIGGNFFAGSKTRNHFNIGVSGVALPTTGNTPPYTYATLQDVSIGVYGTGELANTHDRVPGRNWAGWFDGDVKIMGSCYQNITWQFSDKRLKTDIKALENISDKIQKLGGYTYSYNTAEFKDRFFDDKKHIGLIAQEVKEVFPELITEDAQGFYAVDYQGMIPVLLEAAKEQGKMISEQTAQIAKQQQQIDELKSLVQSLAGAPKSTTIPVNLSDKNTIVLDQNMPNPFAESTVISYNIPVAFTKAQVIFTNGEGKIIKVVDITEKGANSLTVFANDLTHGVYIYKLVVDGKTIDTKKMIKE